MGVSSFEIVLHCLFVATAMSIPAVLFDKSLFSYHPSLMSLGYLLFLAEGVIAGLKLRNPLASAAREAAATRHMLLNVAGVLCAAGGMIAIYRNKELLGKPHFATTHGKFGAVAAGMTVFSQLTGAASFKVVPRLGRPRLLRAVRLSHRRVGRLAWLFALAALELGLLTRAAASKGATMQTAWQVAVATTGAAVVAYSQLGGWRLSPEELEAEAKRARGKSSAEEEREAAPARASAREQREEERRAAVSGEGLRERK